MPCRSQFFADAAAAGNALGNHGRAVVPAVFFYPGLRGLRMHRQMLHVCKVQAGNDYPLVPFRLIRHVLLKIVRKLLIRLLVPPAACPKRSAFPNRPICLFYHFAGKKAGRMSVKQQKIVRMRQYAAGSGGCSGCFVYFCSQKQCFRLF